MKKQILLQLLIITFITLVLISCNNVGSSIEGEYIDCDGHVGKMTITKKQGKDYKLGDKEMREIYGGEFFILQVVANKKEVWLIKKADGVYADAQGMSTIMYDETKKHFILIVQGEGAITLCKTK